MTGNVARGDQFTKDASELRDIGDVKRASTS